MTTSRRRVPNFMVLTGFMVVHLGMSAVRMSLKLVVMLTMGKLAESVLDCMCGRVAMLISMHCVMHWNTMIVLSVVGDRLAGVKGRLCVVMIKCVSKVIMVALSWTHVLTRCMMRLRIVVSLFEHWLLVETASVFGSVFFAFELGSQVMSARVHFFHMGILRVRECFFKSRLVTIAILWIFLAQKHSIVMRIVSSGFIVRIVVNIITIFYIVEDSCLVWVHWILLFILQVKRHPLISFFLLLRCSSLFICAFVFFNFRFFGFWSKVMKEQLMLVVMRLLIVNSVPVEVVKVIVLWLLLISVNTLIGGMHVRIFISCVPLTLLMIMVHVSSFFRLVMVLLDVMISVQVDHELVGESTIVSTILSLILMRPHKVLMIIVSFVPSMVTIMLVPMLNVVLAIYLVLLVIHKTFMLFLVPSVTIMIFIDSKI